MKVVGYDPYFKGEAALDGRVKIATSTPSSPS